MKEYYVLGVWVVALGASVISAKPLNYYQYRSLLTADGCVWAQVNGIKVKQDGRTCEAIVRLHPHSFSQGGYILLDDDRTIDVTSALILSSERLDKDALADTPGQKRAIKRIELVVIIALMIIVLIARFSRKRRETKDDETKQDQLENRDILDVVKVEADISYSLHLEFENSEKRIFDMTPYLEKKAFAHLKNPVLFAEASVGYGTVVWPGNLDIAPETLYDKSIPAHDHSK